MATRKLTPALLRKIVLEERNKVLEEKKKEMGLLGSEAIEVEADEFGTDKVLEDPEDFTVKEAKIALRKIEMMERDERALIKKLRELREQKSRTIKKLRK